MTNIRAPLHAVCRSGRWIARSGQVEAEGASEDDACRRLATLLMLAEVTRRETATAACGACHQPRAECLCPRART